MVIDVAADFVPDFLHELPLVDEPRLGALEQERRIQLARGPSCAVAVEPDGTRGAPEAGLRLPATPRPLDEYGTRGPEPALQLRIDEARAVVSDAASYGRVCAHCDVSTHVRLRYLPVPAAGPLGMRQTLESECIRP